MENTQEEKILSELDNFNGTEQYHKISIGDLLATDGFKGFCDLLKCYWLSDIVSSTQHLKKIQAFKSFIVWKIKRVDKGFIVSAYSDYSSEQTEKENKKYLLYEQKGEYTDFKLNEYEFYQNDNIVLLKSEY